MMFVVMWARVGLD